MGVGRPAYRLLSAQGPRGTCFRSSTVELGILWGTPATPIPPLGTQGRPGRKGLGFRRVSKYKVKSQRHSKGSLRHREFPGDLLLSRNTCYSWSLISGFICLWGFVFRGLE